MRHRVMVCVVRAGGNEDDDNMNLMQGLGFTPLEGETDGEGEEGGSGMAELRRKVKGLVDSGTITILR
jgi:hypothetical protein